MLRERVANNVFVFTSELYAQVTAGAIITPAGAIVIDTLPYPVETRQIVQFIEERHGVPVRYVVNTHYHADHTYGTCFFKHARVVSHHLCYELLNTRGRESLARTRRSSRDMAEIRLVLPDIVFDEGVLSLHLGGTTLEMWHAPGHSPDSIICMVKEERILFAADTLMPLPFLADGNWEDYIGTLEDLLTRPFENVIQGHGEVILRGEVQEKVKEDLEYLRCIHDKISEMLRKGKDFDAVEQIEIEACGKSRIPLNGLVQQLHRTNVETLYQALKNQREEIEVSQPIAN
ncbi:MAG: MBL fold metallo-hydrolase [Anaerolineae bacterium]|nr:MBL fold metallo-hydrolase [Anaerolineae bacterium]